MRRAFRPIVVMALVCCAVGHTSADELSDLNTKLEQVQRENSALQEQVKRLLTRVEVLERAGREPARETKEMASAIGPLSDAALTAETASLGAPESPRLHLQGFANTTFQASVTERENGNTFALGAIDLFMTSEVTDRVSVLVESDFGSSSSTNSTSLFLQRAHVKYSYSDLLNITLGKIHAPLGYWSQAFHHGAWVQATIFRPDIVRFEFDDGFLPVHFVGIDISGVQDFDGLGLGYNIGVGNGRGRTVTEIQHGKDKNDSKAINFHVKVSPDALPGLTIGSNLYHDEIPANPPTATRLRKIDEWIVGEYLTYERGGAQLLSELYEILHDDHTAGTDYDTFGGYVQGSYRISRFIPYYRFDFVEVADGDPFFTAPRNIDRTRHTWGLRWDVLPWNALKFEYSFASMTRDDDEHAIAADWSFAF